MRVLHVSACYPPTWAFGGIPRAVHALAQAQRSAGIDARVWTTDALDAAQRAPADRLLDGVPVTRARNASVSLAWEHQLYLPLGAMPSLEGIDVVHLHGHRHLLNARAFRAARRANLPVVLTAHGTVPRIERKQTLKRAWDVLVDGHVPREADAVIALSRAEARQLVAEGISGARIRRIPNAVTMDAPAPSAADARARLGLPDGPLVAYLGQITPRKGVDRLVAAFGDGSLAPATLVIAGPARGMAVPAGVRHLGVLAGEARLDLLAAADVLVYPSTHEVFGLVPLEGLLCGAPVIVGDDCGCGEIVAEAGAGLLIDGSVASLRAAIRTLLQDRARAAEMVANGQRFIGEHLSPEKVAASHRALYEALTSRRSRA